MECYGVLLGLLDGALAVTRKTYHYDPASDAVVEELHADREERERAEALQRDEREQRQRAWEREEAERDARRSGPYL